MNEIAYSQLADLAARPEEMESAICYIEKHISAFLRPRDRVLICFVNTPGNFGHIVEQDARKAQAGFETGHACHDGGGSPRHLGAVHDEQDWSLQELGHM